MKQDVHLSNVNTTLGTRQIIETHLLVYGKHRNYTFWYHYEECIGKLLLKSQPKDEDEDHNGEAVEGCGSEDEVKKHERFVSKS